MKKIILSLFALMLMACSSGNKHANKMCGLIEQATEKIEKATTLNEISQLEKKLFQDIAVYSLSMTAEEEKALGEDKEASMQLDKAVQNFKKVKEDRMNKIKK